MVAESKRKVVCKEQDLDNLLVGDVVRVSLNYKDDDYMVYEGVLDGEDAFIEISERSTSDELVLNSWRSERRFLSFGSTIVTFSHLLHTNLFQYSPNSELYAEKVKLIEGML